MSDINTALNQGFDLTNMIRQAAGNVPLWAFGLLCIRYWLGRQNKAEAERKKSIEDLKTNLTEKLNRIELRLAESGISDLKKNIEELKEHRSDTNAQLKALWRCLEPEKRASDQ